MKARLVPSRLLPTLFLALAPAALAGTPWFVDGANSSDSNAIDSKGKSFSCNTWKRSNPTLSASPFT